MSLKVLLEEAASYVEKREVINTSISKADIGWHIDHLLKAIIGVEKSVKESDPKDYKSSFNFTRAFVFLFNKIPRGKAKTSKKLAAKEEVTERALAFQLKLAQRSLNNLQNHSEDAFLRHAIFGDLKKKKTIKFLEIHTEHHLKIIRDILFVSEGVS